MVREGIGSIFRRKDGKFFVYLPQGVVEDSAFPFDVNSSTKVTVSFTNDREIIVRPLRK